MSEAVFNDPAVMAKLSPEDKATVIASASPEHKEAILAEMTPVERESMAEIQSAMAEVCTMREILIATVEFASLKAMHRTLRKQCA